MPATKDARKSLITAATNLFYRKGYPNSTIREIGTKAKISNSVIYHYFKNKEEMLYEIIKLGNNGLLRMLTDIQDKNSDPAECLKTMIYKHLADWFLRYKKESKIIVFDDAWLTGKRKEENIISQRKIYEIYKQKLGELQDRGFFVNTDLTVLTFSIIGVITQSIRWFRDDGPLTKEEVAQNIIGLFFNNICSDEDSGHIVS